MRNKDINRRDFVKVLGAGILGLGLPNYAFAQEKPKKIIAKEFSKLPSPDYYDVAHNEIKWESASKGLDFSRTEVYRNKELVDVIATLKINPEENKLRVFNGYSSNNSETHTIEDWQKKTGALAMINSAQYMKNYFPGGLVICDGKQKGPKQNKIVRGMLLAEPKDLEGKLKKADLLDFKYDNFNYKTTQYTQGVQHWPILLNREGNIRVNSTLWQANRTVVAKTKKDEVLFMTTESGYFTLHNFAIFLKKSNQREDKGFNIHTAMNLDGAYSTQMILKSPNLEYLNYGKFVRRNPQKEVLPFKVKVKLPGVIGVFPRV